MPNTRISVRVDKKLRRRLSELARRSKQTDSQFIRQALAEYVEKGVPRESAYDLALRAGIIGVSKRGPRDLSTNPRHMEGFGGD